MYERPATPFVADPGRCRDPGGHSVPTRVHFPRGSLWGLLNPQDSFAVRAGSAERA